MRSSMSRVIITQYSHSQQAVEEREEMVQAVNPKIMSHFTFPCPVCRSEGKEKCTACQGTGTLDNSTHFSKFVNAIVDYKMGGSPGGKEEIPPNSGKRELQESRITSSSITQVSERKHEGEISGGSCIDRSSISYKSQMKKCLPVMIHPGIQCDVCHQHPIQGIRYRCKQCKDYDVCSKCYQSTKHHHKNFQTLFQSKTHYQKYKLRESVQTVAATDCLKLGNVLSRIPKLFK